MRRFLVEFCLDFVEISRYNDICLANLLLKKEELLQQYWAVLKLPDTPYIVLTFAIFHNIMCSTEGS